MAGGGGDWLWRLTVTPLRFCARVKGCVYPVFRVCEPNGQELVFQRLVSGGDALRPELPMVAFYARSDGRVCVLKAIPPEDAANELLAIALAPRGSCMVPARVVSSGTAPDPSRPLRLEDYVIVLMPYAGDTLGSKDLTSPRPALEALHDVARICYHLFETCGLAYTDLKATNVLFSDRGLVLCDYGGLALRGTRSGTATFPPPWSPRGTDVPADEACVAYGFGALLVNLVLPHECNRIMYVDVDRASALGDAERVLGAECEAVRAAVAKRDAGLGRVLAAAWRPKATLRGVFESIEAELGP